MKMLSLMVLVFLLLTGCCIDKVYVRVQSEGGLEVAFDLREIREQR